MTHANKILYIGAGCHIEPVSHLTETKEFVFIDTQPRSEYETLDPSFDSQYYRYQFLINLEAECSNYGFELETSCEFDNNYFNQIISWKQYFFYCFHKIPPAVNPILVIFTNKKTNQLLKYYISTNIHFNMNISLKNDIETSDGFIISGYNPSMDILNYFKTPKAFFGYTGTVYDLTDTNDNKSIIYFLTNFICNIPYFFTDFYAIEKGSGTIIKCTDFKEFILTIENNLIDNNLSETHCTDEK